MSADAVTVLCTDPADLLGHLGRLAAEYGGTPSRGPGNTQAMSFSSADAALSCAREIQRAIEMHGEGAQPRIGVHAAKHDDALDLASRLCSTAESGQVLVSDFVRALVASTGGNEFRELGEFELPDAATSVRVWELLWREPEPRTKVRLCGAPGLVIDGRDVGAEVPAGQAGELLWYLIAHRAGPIERAELIEILWPEKQPKDPYSDLRPILSRVRRVLGTDSVQGREHVRIALPEPVWVDVEEALRAIDAAHVAARGADWERVREQSQIGLDLLNQSFLAGRDGDWVESRRRELDELVLEALELAARGSIAVGGNEELGTAERAARELVAQSPYRETGYRFLMEALAAGGNVAEALRVYEELRHLLREELGVTPAAELRDLHGRLLAGDSVAPVRATPQAPTTERVPLPALLSPRERTALIGRTRELEVLRAAWSRVRSGGRQLVLVGGDPGIGKTRLMSEIALEAHSDGTVLHGACEEEALISYQPFVEALRHYARSRPLSDAASELGPGTAELARMIPELAPALPQLPEAAPDDPEARRYLMFEAVSSLLTRAAAHTPLLLVMDDLQWADRPTLKLLRHIMRSEPEASLLIVGAYRDAEIGTEHPLSELLTDLRREKLVDRVSITGLDERDVAALISSQGHDATSAFVRTVHETTDGNPFFVEEVMRHLIETGVLFEREGRWSSALTPDEIGVPQGVKEVIARRLAGLSEYCRDALTRAAVLGREFSFVVLQQMAESEDDALIGALEEALNAQLVTEALDTSNPAFAFTHALVRETLYGGLSGPRRQQLHARAARAIEATGDTDAVAALALHHRQAGSAGDAPKAIEFSLQAGNRARELFAWEEAVTHWSGALEVMERTDAGEEVRARLLVALADLLVVVGNLGDQIEYLERALELYQRLGDEERTAQVHSRLGMAHCLIDSIYADHLDIHRAFRHYDTARPVLERGHARRARGHLEVGVASALAYGLQIERGIEAAARGMDIAERIGDEALWASAAEAYAWHKIVAGNLRVGLDTLERAFEVADRRRQSFLAWMASNTGGQLTWGLSDPDAAQRFVERSLSRPYVGENTHRRVVADSLGRCHACRGEMVEARGLLSDAKPTWITHSLKPLLDLWDGNWDEVDALARRILETSRRTGNRWDEWASHHLSARVASLRGEHKNAAELLERALEIVVEGGAPYFEMWVRPDLALARAEIGQVDEARRHVERCKDIMSNGEDWRGRGGNVTVAEASVLAAEDRPDAADQVFDEALRIFRRYKLRVDEAEALHHWGRSLVRAGDPSGAVAKFDAALEIYKTHGAGRAWLEHLAMDIGGLQKTGR